jgi:DNA repair exonuclease SbcCD ATPase subunit
MTEQQIQQHEKIQAEIANLIATSARLNAETDRISRSETDKLMAETAKLNAETDRISRTEISKLMAETTKLQSEKQWYPFIVGSSVTLAIVAIVKLFL